MTLYGILIHKNCWVGTEKIVSVNQSMKMENF